MDFEFSRIFNQICETLTKIFQDAFEKTETEIGRPLSFDEKDFLFKLGVPFCFFCFLEKVNKKGDHDG